MNSRKPRIFIGSSREQLPVARAIAEALEYDAECMLWTYIFDPGKYTLESIEEDIHKCDFAILVLVADDMTLSRGRTEASPRDNVVLELGIAIAILSRRRAFYVTDRNEKARVPSDLMGLTPLTFERRPQMTPAVEVACNKIREQIQTQGIRERSTSIVAVDERSLMSTRFALATLRNLSTFAGDLSWLEKDLEVYKRLMNDGRKVRVRFLTETADAPVIKKAKRLGVQFCLYPGTGQAPFKGALSDTDSEPDARALIVKRHISDHVVDDGGVPYRYWMKIYRGIEEDPVIKGLAVLFETLWAKGKKL